MARLKEFSIENYKSIGEQITIKFPENAPIVLIGENNAGKSNIVRAIDLLFGDFHPAYKDMDDHDYYGRTPSNRITIDAAMTDVSGQLSDYGNPIGCSGLKFISVKGTKNKLIGIRSDNGSDCSYFKTDVRGEIKCVVVNSEYSLSYQLSYSSKYTLLSKLTKAFHNKLTSDDKKVEELKGLFSDIKNSFNNIPEFKDFQEDMSKVAGSIMDCMSHALKFDFSAYDPSNYFKTLKVSPTENGEVRTFEELGTGQQQVLALAFAQAYAKSFLNDGLIFIFDEPEVNLHPLAQKWLAKKINELAYSGIQVIISTHNSHFINLQNISALYLVSKVNGSTIVKNVDEDKLYEHCLKTGSNPEKTTPHTVVPFYANQSTPKILNGLFAKKVVLVEGLTEELSLPIWCERLGFDTMERGIEFISVEGKSNLSKWWRFFNVYNIPTFVIFDNDHKLGNEFNYDKALKESHFPEELIKDLITAKEWLIQDHFLSFGTNYEVTMRNSFPDYLDIEKSQADLYGTASKHIIAKETARLVDLSKRTRGLEMLNVLIDYLGRL
jgi:putative ATP-dependent endonuclease of OLD family